MLQGLVDSGRRQRRVVEQQRPNFFKSIFWQHRVNMTKWATRSWSMAIGHPTCNLGCRETRQTVIAPSNPRVQTVLVGGVASFHNGVQLIHNCPLK